MKKMIPLFFVAMIAMLFVTSTATADDAKAPEASVVVVDEAVPGPCCKAECCPPMAKRKCFPRRVRCCAKPAPCCPVQECCAPAPCEPCCKKSCCKPCCKSYCKSWKREKVVVCKTFCGKSRPVVVRKRVPVCCN